MQRRNELWIIVVDVAAIDVVIDAVIDVVIIVVALIMDLILYFGCLYYFSSKLE